MQEPNYKMYEELMDCQDINEIEKAIIKINVDIKQLHNIKHIEKCAAEISRLNGCITILYEYRDILRDRLKVLRITRDLDSNNTTRLYKNFFKLCKKELDQKVFVSLLQRAKTI